MAKTIEDSVAVLSGVGEKRVQALNELGIYTIYDLFTHFPFRYEDLTVKSIEEIEDKEKVVLKGPAISDAVVQHFGRRKSRLQFRLNIEHVIVPVTFFNQPYLKDKVKAGEEIAVFGTWDALRKQMSGIKILFQTKEGEENREPVYRSSKKIKQPTLVKLIKAAWVEYKELIPEKIPASILQKYKLVSHAESIRMMHFPENGQEMEQARRAIIFHELFLYQLRMQWLRKQHKTTGVGREVEYDVDVLREFFQSLPFDLTSAQKRVVNEICKDMKQPIQMYRLLQGDVGSGKTVVAAASIIAAWTAGLQSAFMAPTEILAEQHMQSLEELFAKMDITIALLTGSTKAKERREILEGLAAGRIDSVVGTHALIQDDVLFNELGLVITDEQHRFGVNQRRTLREKGDHPDVLFMTATPIPRTLSITAFGEMDVSVIDEMPAGRKPIKTHWIRPKHFSRMIEFVKKEVANQSQVYVISPLIEESEMMDLENATELYQIYQQELGPAYTVGLLHGKMPAQEKESIMQEFKAGRIQVLVSTTVIEVGVNVPNATLMVIHDADRFGLAQLHQLRGRVGRGSKESYCILIADPKGEAGAERMDIMTKTNDGFELSEKDLEMRGPGEIFGKKQSGLPEFKMADIVEDFAALEAARREAGNLLIQEDFFEQEEYALLWEELGVAGEKQASLLD
jgi:ATP-dependent DNA helicase RecG